MLLLGAVLYPTLLCVAWTAQLGGGALGGVAMILLSVGNAAVCTELRLFRVAATASPVSHLAQTALQILPFWGIFLGVLPWLVAELDPWRWSMGPIGTLVGTALFVAASALGLWSAAVMATRGAGTPLPTACPARLVTDGPYRFVRNPMATAGIVLGVISAAIGAISDSANSRTMSRNIR